MLQRSKTLDTSAMAAAMGAAGGSSRQPYAPADGPRAEIDEPCVPLTMSDAFAVATQEGALHENHDRGATVILPDGTCLFTCLDGHGAEGASVSGYSTRNLLAGCAAALQEGQSPSDAVTSAFARTAATMPHNVRRRPRNPTAGVTPRTPELRCGCLVPRAAARDHPR